jgi:hypothetical protein
VLYCLLSRCGVLEADKLAAVVAEAGRAKDPLKPFPEATAALENMINRMCLRNGALASGNGVSFVRTILRASYLVTRMAYPNSPCIALVHSPAQFQYPEGLSPQEALRNIWQNLDDYIRLTSDEIEAWRPTDKLETLHKYEVSPSCGKQMCTLT